MSSLVTKVNGCWIVCLKGVSIGFGALALGGRGELGITHN